MPTSCVVTGGARGIGRGIAELMVARGHHVLVTDIDGEAAARTAEEIGAVAGLTHDVRDPDAHRAVAAAATEHGRLAAWFNNAGLGTDGTISQRSDEEVRALVEVNLLGVIWGTRAALAAFGAADGDVVNIASLSGLGPVPGLTVYAATKAAVVSLSSSAHLETPARIRVHALCPDGVATDMLAAMDPEGMGRRLVFSGGRLLTVDEIAREAVALVGSRRVVRTVPGWRAAAMRAGALTPSQARPVMALLALQGKRAIRKH